MRCEDAWEMGYIGIGSDEPIQADTQTLVLLHQHVSGRIIGYMIAPFGILDVYAEDLLKTCACDGQPPDMLYVEKPLADWLREEAGVLAIKVRACGIPLIEFPSPVQKARTAVRQDLLRVLRPGDSFETMKEHVDRAVESFNASLHVKPEAA